MTLRAKLTRSRSLLLLGCMISVCLFTSFPPFLPPFSSLSLSLSLSVCLCLSLKLYLPQVKSSSNVRRPKLTASNSSRQPPPELETARRAVGPRTRRGWKASYRRRSIPAAVCSRAVRPACRTFVLRFVICRVPRVALITLPVLSPID